ncbi:MAG: tetratricopeptide repeat protein [Eubacteriales bacterium]|nr:tetratricopeptide repeat protein [Eubacteriales bacterium]
MSSGKPVVRQIAWLSIVPQLFIMGILVLIFHLFVKPFKSALILAMIIYLAVSLILRRCVPHHHRKGILLYQQGNYEKAIEEFRKSYDFFCRHTWIDKYRCITLLSSSRTSYTEMALLNIAFCYTQSNNAKLSKEYYQRVLELFPKSEMAKSALNMISSFENEEDDIDG